MEMLRSLRGDKHEFCLTVIDAMRLSSDFEAALFWKK